LALLLTDAAKSIVEALREVSLSPTSSADSGGELTEDLLHIDRCPQCRAALERLMAAEMKMRNQLGRIGGRTPAPTRTPDCPPEDVWTDIGARLAPPDLRRSATAHAAGCAYCGPLLREAMADLADPTEFEIAEANAIATPEWRAALLQRMGATPPPAPVAAAPRPSAFGWLWSPAKFAGSFAAIAVVAGLAWFQFRETELHKVNRLLAQSYTEQRPFDLRFGDAPYSLKGTQRGNDREAPAALSDAKARATTELKAHPEDPLWLDARARVDLLEGNYDKAIDRLTHASEVDSRNSDIKGDLGSAYFLRGEKEHRPIDYGNAYELLSQALENNPDRLDWLYNRALAAEETFAFQSAIDDWNHYLRLDSKSPWADQAREHLAEIQKKLKSQRDRAPAVYASATEFLLHDSPDEISKNAEQYIDIATKNWLPVVYSSRQATPERDAAAKVAAVLRTRHGDAWLSAMLAAAATQSSAAMQSLAAAITSDAAGQFDEGRVRAEAAEKAFRRSGNVPGALRARVEQVYSLQRAFAGQRCLDAAKGIGADSHARDFRWLEVRASIDETACAIQSEHTDAAVALAQHAARIAQDASYPNLHLRAVASLSTLAASTGDFALAWSLNHRGLEAYWNGPPNPRQGLTFYSRMVNVAEQVGYAHQALGLAREAVQLGSQLEHAAEVPERFRLARLASVTNQESLSRSQLEKAEQIVGADRDKTGVQDRVWAEIAFARLQASRGDRAGALTRLASIRETANHSDSYLMPLRYYTALGDAQYGQGSVVEASASFRQAVQIAQTGLTSISGDRDRVTWVRESSHVYRALVQSQLREHAGSREAWETWEKYKSASLKIGDRNLDLAALQAKLDERTTYVTYAFLPDGLAVWLVNRARVETFFPVGSADEIRALAERFSRGCANPESDSASLQQTGRRLYAAVLESFVKDLPPDSPLVIEPDAELSAVPFGALALPAGKFLGDLFDVGVSPGFLYQAARRPEVALSRDLRALVVGPPAISQDIALPEAATEAKYVASLFPKSTLLDGAKASVEEVERELPSANVIHFAVHGQAGVSGSGLRLWSGAEPALLGPSRLNPASLRSGQLVVLSACETAGGSGGDISDPDSLVRSVLAAGVPRVVASRWSINSAAAATFMNALYAALLAGRPAAAAVRAAAAKTRASRGMSHPYYWAAFDSFGAI